LEGRGRAAVVSGRAFSPGAEWKDGRNPSRGCVLESSPSQLMAGREFLGCVGSANFLDFVREAEESVHKSSPVRFH